MTYEDEHHDTFFKQCDVQANFYSRTAPTIGMVDITVFRMEIDDSTFNAPFGGRARSDGAPTETESSGPSMKLIAGLGGVLLLTLLALIVLLKRTFGGDGDEDEDDDEDAELVIDTDAETDSSEGEDRGGIRAIIGLSFLVVLTVLMRRWKNTEPSPTGASV